MMAGMTTQQESDTIRYVITLTMKKGFNSSRKCLLLKAFAYWMTLLLLLNPSLHAQLKGTHLMGDMGLQSGTQPPPSLTLFVPMYNYHTSSFIKADGDKVNAPSINMFLLGVGAGIVTDAKIFGGKYGASVLMAFASSRIEGRLEGSGGFWFCCRFGYRR